MADAETSNPHTADAPADDGVAHSSIDYVAGLTSALPPSSPSGVPSAPHLQHLGSNSHTRGQESFSRSRSSTGAILDAFTPGDDLTPVDERPEPQTDPVAPGAASAAGTAEAFFQGAEMSSSLQNPEDVRTKATQELEHWATENDTELQPPAAVAVSQTSMTAQAASDADPWTNVADGQPSADADFFAGGGEPAPVSGGESVPASGDEPAPTSGDASMAQMDFDEVTNETVGELEEPLLAHSPANDPSPQPPAEPELRSAAQELSQDLEVPDVEPEADTSWLAGDEDKGELEDSWAKALGGTEQEPVGASWENAFGDSLDADGFLDDGAGFLDDGEGFLDDTAHATGQSQAQPQMPDQGNYRPRTSSKPATQAAAPYAPPPSAVVAPPPIVNGDRSSSGGMKFFEDLPMAPVSKPKRSKPVVMSADGGISSAPPPPGQHSSRGAPPPGPPSRSTSGLEMFPSQPTVPPQQMMAAAASTSPALQLPPQTSARYSPAPGQPPASASRYSSGGSSSAARGAYSPAPASVPAPQQTAPPPQAMTTSPPTQLTSAPPPSNQAPPKMNSRYSPAPRQPQSSPGAAPIPQHQHADDPQSTLGPVPPSLSAHRFAPRTSSPLASSERRPGLDRAATFAADNVQSPLTGMMDKSAYPAPPAAYTPGDSAPRRPRTQSPELSKSILGPRKPSHEIRPTAYQPASSNAYSSRSQAHFQSSSAHGADDNLNFMQPSDPYLANDPLQRWKGAPVFCWSPGGLTSTHFPKHVPMYAGGQAAPAVKSSPGQIKLERTRSRVPVDPTLMSFPGPLKSKGKKKELLTWLSTQVETKQREASEASVHAMDPRAEERLMLWQLLRVFIEHDGVLSGNPAADLAVRSVLNKPPNHSRSNSTDEDAPAVNPDSVNPTAVGDIKRHLMNGEREKAVWLAADNRLWGHALLMSSTAPDGGLWKQVTQEFVRSELRHSAGETKSLAALYQIFAHNWDESVDELVPASARAGFQMMPTADRNGHTQNALDGLNRWQETVCMVLGTRSAEDERGLLSLGRLLRSYGRIEAAHICFLFSRGFARPGGIDDAEADFTLLGADSSEESLHDPEAILLSEVFEFGLSLNPSSGASHLPHLQAYKLHHAHLLADSGYRDTAMSYCEAISHAIKSMTRMSPYYHPALVMELEDLQKRLSEAPKDGSSSWMSKPSLGKVSGSVWARFNTFVTGDDDATSNGSGGHSEAEAGPFGRVAGTPSISRNASHADLTAFTPMNTMNPMSGPVAAAPVMAAAPPSNTRYAPNYASQPAQSPPQTAAHPPPANPYAPASVPQEIAKPSSSHSYNPFHHHSALGISDNVSQVSSSYDPPILQPPTSQRLGFDVGSPSFMHSSSRGGSSHGPPSIPSQDQEMSVIDEEEPSKTNGLSPSFSNGYEPPPATGAITELDETEISNGYAPPSAGGYAPPQAGGYAPPEAGGYAPPSAGYQPYEPSQAEQEEAPRRRGMMDDDDDDGLSSRAAAMKSAERAKNDRAADDAFRAAAEADAKRDRDAKEARKSGSWFGGWFKKDPNAPTVHRAKLGEESSFYFDPETKKWVNKKAGDTAAPAAAPTPPPPRAGPPMGMSKPPSASSSPGLGALPPRTSSAGRPSQNAPPSMAPAPGPSSRTATPSTDAAPAGVAAPTGSNVPSRPPTSMSNASSIDDLIGAPAARKPGGAGKKGKKGGRYVDVMAK